MKHDKSKGEKLQKVLLTTFIHLLIITGVFAQIPSKMSYQAVIRDAANKLVINQPIGIQISLLQGSAEGSSVYTETHQASTNANGLVTIEIGNGNVSTGDFETIDWADGPIFIRTSTDPSGGSAYTLTATSQLLSVPYALLAKTAESAKETDPHFTTSPASAISSAGSGEVISTAERIKLTHIEEGAQVNVQADWNQTDPDADDFIKNKFDVPSFEDRLNNVNNIHDSDWDTKIQVEQMTNDDKIRFTIEGAEKWVMNGYVLESKNTGKSLFIGEEAGKNDDLSDNQNTFIGYQSGFSNTTGYNNTASGAQSLHLNTMGAQNTAFGTAALRNNSIGYGNTANGANALLSNTFGSYNTALGFHALTINFSGNKNTAIGTQALASNFNGSFNTATGNKALIFNSVGMSNSAYGTEAGFSNVAGSGNIFLGYQAGYFETGSNKLYIENSDITTPLIYGDFENDLVKINGALVVTGDVDFQSNGSFVNLTVKGEGTTSGQHVALFENTGAGSGDGIKIKLGKATANNGLPSFPTGIAQAEIDQIKNLINCNFDGNKVELLGEIIAEGLIVDAQTIGGLAVGVGNLVTGFINGQLNLPLKSPSVQIIPKITVFPGFYLGMPSIAGVGIPNIDIPSKQIGEFLLPSFTMFPKIPDISLSVLDIPEIKINDLDFWGIPNICFNDVVTDPLNNDNEFIHFADKNNVPMGAIKAQSVSNWVSNYLNPLFLMSLRGALNSTLDKKHAQYHFKGKISEALASYPKIGVEYTSGNGDYAEWLERVNPDEAISAGDIVGVRAGKITKSLVDAEQVMAVSHKPIVLGNVPSADKIKLGNNVAFMGQIPVKIMGPVATGDYILGNNEIPGYGKAVHPEDMSIEDFRMAVGRAWESNLETGPLTVNTVIGIHNASFLNVFKQYEQKIKETQVRLESVEVKIDKLTGLISTANKTN